MHCALCLLSLLLLAGCADRAGDAAPLAAHPFARHALAPEQRSVREGEVMERLLAGPYVYLRVRCADGSDLWLVSLRATTPASTRVRALILGRARRFHSQRLARDFSPLLFAAVQRIAADAPAPAHQQPGK